MFHYVKSDFNYYHFDLKKFEEYVQANRDRIVSLDNYLKSENKADKIVLTFDDGTIDHYENVFPILKKYGVTGVFSVCDNVYNGTVLDIQKIHYLMSNIGIDKLFDDVCSVLHQSEDELISNYFTKENTIKKLLQRDLDKLLAGKILDKIVKKNNLKLDCSTIYMSPENIKTMQSFGNEFVYHTANHCWLGSLDRIEQMREIQNVVKYVYTYGFKPYLTLPFGDYNDYTIEILRDLGIDIVIGVNYTNSNNVLTRVDCSCINK